MENWVSLGRKKRSHKFSNLDRTGVEQGDLVAANQRSYNCANYARPLKGLAKSITIFYGGLDNIT